MKNIAYASRDEVLSMIIHFLSITTEPYWEPNQTCKMDLFAKIAWQGSEYPSVLKGFRNSTLTSTESKKLGVVSVSVW